MYPTKSLTKIRNTCVHTSGGVVTFYSKHLFFTKMWFEDDIAIVAAAYVILILESKERKKKRFWVRPSLLTRNILIF